MMCLCNLYIRLDFLKCAKSRPSSPFYSGCLFPFLFCFFSLGYKIWPVLDACLMELDMILVNKCIYKHKNEYCFLFWREGGLQENIFSQAYEAEIKLVFKNMIRVQERGCYLAMCAVSSIQTRWGSLFITQKH